jgi:alpha-glucosidase/lysosomal alpha-glucosidase
LFFEFSDDLETLKDNVLDTQIILGKELMAAPILTQDTVIRSVYFP